MRIRKIAAAGAGNPLLKEWALREREQTDRILLIFLRDRMSEGKALGWMSKFQYPAIVFQYPKAQEHREVRPEPE